MTPYAAVPRAITARIGTLVAGRYALEATLGHGAATTVYRARDGRHGSLRVAVKLLDDSCRDAPATAERFVREARAIDRVRHPNVVRVLDAGVCEGEPYLVTELLEGETLATRLDRAPGPLSLREAAQIALPVLDGLFAAHHAGVVHRDLKPANVILHRGGPEERLRPVLVDFGISKLLPAGSQRDSWNSLSVPGTVFGTPHYISPEQAVNAHAVDARTDVWAAGVMLYRMLVGRVPFDAPHVGALLGMVLENLPPTPASFGVPQSVSAVVMRCLDKIAARRYADAGELARALADALGVPADGEARRLMPSLRIAPPPPCAVTVRPPRPTRAV